MAVFNQRGLCNIRDENFEKSGQQDSLKHKLKRWAIAYDSSVSSYSDLPLHYNQDMMP